MKISHSVSFRYDYRILRKDNDKVATSKRRGGGALITTKTEFQVEKMELSDAGFRYDYL